MTSDEIRSYLRSQFRLILVSNGLGGYPHPMPMNFVFDDNDRFVMTTFRKSQKVRNFQRDPRATLLVESGVAYGDLQSVLAYSKAEIIDDAEEVLQTMKGIMARESEITGKDMEKVRGKSQLTISKRVVLRFTADTYTSWDHSKLSGGY